MINAIFGVALQFFAAPPGHCESTFFGLKSWFAYLPANWFGTASDSCSINGNFQFLGTGGESGIILIGLAVLDDLLRIASLVAVGFIIYGGFAYMTSQGAPDATKKAQQTVINALIGLVLAIVAASIVAFIGNRLSS